MFLRSILIFLFSFVLFSWNFSFSSATKISIFLDTNNQEIQSNMMAIDENSFEKNLDYSQSPPLSGSTQRRLVRTQSSFYPISSSSIPRLCASLTKAKSIRNSATSSTRLYSVTNSDWLPSKCKFTLKSLCSIHRIKEFYPSSFNILNCEIENNSIPVKTELFLKSTDLKGFSMAIQLILGDFGWEINEEKSSQGFYFISNSEKNRKNKKLKIKN